MTTSSPGLSWPEERADAAPDERHRLALAASNIVLDLHGDPVKSQVSVFSDGNHHMALAETLTSFLALNPEAADVFFLTLPPRLVIAAMQSGTVTIGNLTVSCHADVLIGPAPILADLHQAGRIGLPRAFMRSSGLSILVRKGNPTGVGRVVDLLDRRVRLAISNPVTETASFGVYETGLLATADRAGRSPDALASFLRSDAVLKSALIHHREIPELIARGHADASLLYHHLALRYARVFPEIFDLVEVPAEEWDDAAAITTTYQMALVGDGGRWGEALVRFLDSGEVTGIYEYHGLRRG